MTDNFLQKLEEKVMILLTDLESLRKELVQLREENGTLKAEKTNHMKKLQGLLGLLESLEEPQDVVVMANEKKETTWPEELSA